jgi:hypothetical protein
MTYIKRSALLLAFALLLALSLPVRAEDLPRQFSDRDFWKLITDMSEPNGFFQYENFVSNEDDYPTVLSALSRTVKPGGVYVGVGPEQNFTYVAAFRPGIAFVVDIRRQNMLEHLLYKALFELSATRNEFVSRLFSRPAISGVSSSSNAEALLKPYENVRPDQRLYDSNLAAIVDRLIKTHGFALSNDDKQGIAKVLKAFFDGGPAMDYRFASYTAPTPSATFTQLMDAADRDGRRWSFLTTEENFRLVQDYEKKNLIVPLVGDFAGPKTMREVGKYAKEHNSVVSVFYTSNVDEYLFRDTAKDRFFSSIATFPMESSSSMIRALGVPGGAPSEFLLAAGKRWAAVWCSMPELVKAFNAGQIQARTDANRLCSR